MAQVTRKSHGLLYECPSPSIWLLVGGPVTLAFDGLNWVVSMTDREGYFREGRYTRRDEALATVGRAYGRGSQDDRLQ